MNHFSSFLRNYGVVLALLVFLIIGEWRYDEWHFDKFLGSFNVLTYLRYTSMSLLVALGMAFVIFTGGIDLSVGAVVALGSVTAALASQFGLAAGVAAGIGAGIAVGILNATIITRLAIAPFIATLATMLAARGAALLLAGNQSVAISTDTAFMAFGQNDFLGFPIPAWIALLAYIIGSVVLNFTSFGRNTLAIGGNEDAARLMGLRADRVKVAVYVLSGGLSGLAGASLAAQNFAGQPLEGTGWELSAIAAVVVGGSLLTGGKGSVGTTLVGALLLGLIFNMLNFENGLGWISLSAYWQSVIRGLILLAVVILQVKLVERRPAPSQP